MSQGSTNYRPDIDGLRAIAVTAVVLFHASLASFSRGFLGVDIFFVISGFLITGLILKEADNETFSLVNFYERRVRRILPAALFMFAIITVIAWGVYLPSTMVSYGHSLIAASTFSSNWYFLSVTSYFGYAAESKPLLHTWTLAVEEQFYLFFPLLLLAIPKKRQAFVVVLLTSCSLIFARHLEKTGQLDEMFFNSFSRFWEPLIGAIAAFIYREYTAGPLPSTILRSAGLFFIFYGFYRSKPGTAYDEILLSCFGAAVFLVARPFGRDWTFRIVASPPFRIIGRLSYSIYLWHWPILVFARMKFGALSAIQIVGCIVLTLALASASFLLIENPIRFKKIVATRRSAFTLAAASSIAICVIGAVSISNGSNAILPPEVQAINSASHWNMNYYRCFDPPGGNAGHQLLEMAKTNNLCVIGNTEKSADDFIVWGDSHAFAELPPFAELATEHHQKGIAAMYPGCPSLINTVNRDLGKDQNCPAFFNAVLKLVQSNDINQVFFVDRWSLYLLGEMKPGLTGILQFSDDWNREKNLQVVFRQSIEQTVESLGERHIVFVKEPPTQRFYVTDVMATNAALGEPVSHLDSRWTTLSAHRRRNDFIDQTFKEISLKHPNVTIVDPTETMCSGDSCPASRDSLPLYWDDDHLSHRGASIILKPLLAPIFEAVSASPNRSAPPDD